MSTEVGGLGASQKESVERRWESECTSTAVGALRKTGVI